MGYPFLRDGVAPRPTWSSCSFAIRSRIEPPPIDSICRSLSLDGLSFFSRFLGSKRSENVRTVLEFASEGVGEGEGEVDDTFGD